MPHPCKQGHGGQLPECCQQLLTLLPTEKLCLRSRQQLILNKLKIYIYYDKLYVVIHLSNHCGRYTMGQVKRFCCSINNNNKKRKSSFLWTTKFFFLNISAVCSSQNSSFCQYLGNVFSTESQLFASTLGVILTSTNIFSFLKKKKKSDRDWSKPFAKIEKSSTNFVTKCRPCSDFEIVFLLFVGSQTVHSKCNTMETWSKNLSKPMDTPYVSWHLIEIGHIYHLS